METGEPGFVFVDTRSQESWNRATLGGRCT